MATVIRMASKPPQDLFTLSRVKPGQIFKHGGHYYVRSILCSTEGCVRLSDGLLAKFDANQVVGEVSAVITVNI